MVYLVRANQSDKSWMAFAFARTEELVDIWHTLVFIDRRFFLCKSNDNETIRLRVDRGTSEDLSYCSRCTDHDAFVVEHGRCIREPRWGRYGRFSAHGTV